MIDDDFKYTQLASLAEYLFSELMETGQDKMQELILHKYVPGPEDGKRVGRGIRWDKKIAANGLEGQLDELRHRFFPHLMDYREELIDRFDNEAQGKVFILERQYDYDTDKYTHFVFTDKTALQAVRFKHFVKDSREIAGDEVDFQALMEVERSRVYAYIEAAYQDVMETYDPKLVKLRKKNKIIVSDKAMDDLSKL